ncbi:hypothetical protein [Chishuiella changwenlii]|uniref:hypothetical protein n=1 Tax=Chishuiella changwenlii TaxID=1434701 RepID=UPI002FDA9D4A
MEKKILFDNDSHESTKTNNDSIEKENVVKPNLFQGRTESETKESKFPDWDIVPPNQFINPRSKSH